MSYPKRESRVYKPEPPGAEPELNVGQSVLLTGKPDRPRRILKVEWHNHRHEFVYIVETSGFFRPYFFRDKLIVAEKNIFSLLEQTSSPLGELVHFLFNVWRISRA
jgi:hypothetical protein